MAVLSMLCNFLFGVVAMLASNAKATCQMVLQVAIAIYRSCTFWNLPATQSPQSQAVVYQGISVQCYYGNYQVTALLPDLQR